MDASSDNKSLLLKQVGVQVVLASVLMLLGIGWTWWLWFSSLMTSYMLVARLRQIAEHAAVPDADNPDPRFNTRTVEAPMWQRFLMAPHFVNYHLEHHLLPGVPCYRLPGFRRLLKEKGLLDEVPNFKGYREVLRHTVNGVSLSPDQWVEAHLGPIAEALSSIVFYTAPIASTDVPLIVIWTAVAGLFFTVYLRLINVRALGLAIRHARGDFADPNARGEISHFKAVATAVSGTVGVGNIGGVAVAISLGGPGAAFWLFIAGLLSMSTKLLECTLGVKYRRYNADGSVSGGPMFYMEAYFRERGWPGIGKGFGTFYALALVIGCLGIGNMFQSNQAFAQFVVITGGEASFFTDRGWLFGLALAAVIGAVIIGGIRSIARVAAVLVPVMGLIYVIAAVVVIGLSARHLPAALALVVSEAFTGQAASGGILGAMVIGFQRALFSNEAGIGSASIAHSAVKTEQPASEGITALLEPFIDTVVVCSLSSLVVLTTAIPQGLMGSELAGIELTSAAFAWHFSWAPYVIAVAALLFAFSSALAWSYYGLKGWTYLLGEGKVRSVVFQMIFCAFIALGCMLELRAVLDFSDAMTFLIALPNVLMLYLFAPFVRSEVNRYLADIKFN